MKLYIKFTDETTNFTKGVEYGRLLQKFEDNLNHIDNNGFPVRLENKELLYKTCTKFNYTAVFGREYYEEWVDFMAMKNVFTDN